MSCLSLSSNICRGCRDSAGGIKRIFAANLCEISAITHDVDSDGHDQGISAITNTGNWYELTPNKNSSNWVENINASVENGTIYYEQIITAVFGKNTQELRNTIEEIGQSELLLVVEDNNGVFWAVGENDGAIVTGGNSASGTAWADLNGWTLTLTAYNRTPASTVSSTLVSSFISPENMCGC